MAPGDKSRTCFDTWSRTAQWPIGYGVGLRIKQSSVQIRPWPLRWVLGQFSLLPLSQGEAFTLASISYLAILVKYILAKKKPLYHRDLQTSGQSMCSNGRLAMETSIKNLMVYKGHVCVCVWALFQECGAPFSAFYTTSMLNLDRHVCSWLCLQRCAFVVLVSNQSIKMWYANRPARYAKESSICC